MLIDLRLEWSSPAAISDPAAVAWGHGELLVGGVPIWGKVHWTWSDLLEHLADIWPWLLWEQAYPLSLNPDDPRHLRTDAEARWNGLNEEQVEDEDEEVHLWEDRHYLSAGLGGLNAAGLGVLREGADALVWTRDMVFRCPHRQLMDELNRVGDLIAARVAQSTSPEAIARLMRWQQRAVSKAADRPPRRSSPLGGAP